MTTKVQEKTTPVKPQQTSTIKEEKMDKMPTPVEEPDTQTSQKPEKTSTIEEEKTPLEEELDPQTLQTPEKNKPINLQTPPPMKGKQTSTPIDLLTPTKLPLSSQSNY
jgi:hypothetical protein